MCKIINKNMFGKKVNVLYGELVVVDKELKDGASLLLTVETVFLMKFGIEFKELSYNQQMGFIEEYIKILKWASAPFADDEFDYNSLNEFKDEFIEMERKIQDWRVTTKIVKNAEPVFDRFDEEDIFGISYNRCINTLTKYNTGIFEYVRITKSKTLFPKEFSNSKVDYIIKRLELKLDFNDLYNSINFKECSEVVKSRIMKDLEYNPKLYSDIPVDQIRREIDHINPFYYWLKNSEIEFHNIIESNVRDIKPGIDVRRRLYHLISSMFSTLVLNYFNSQVSDYSDLEMEKEIDNYAYQYGDRCYKDIGEVFMDSMFDAIRIIITINRK